MAPMRLLVVTSIAILGLISGTIFGYTAAFFFSLWVHLPGPARLEFEFANTFGLGGAAVGAIGGMIIGVGLGWRLTRRRVDGAISEKRGTNDRQNDPPEPSV
jgi:uncharacterized membrane protein SpoIIM required for sporulation